MTSFPKTDAAIVDDHAPRSSGLVPGALVAAIGGPLALAVTNALVGFGPIWGDIETTADLVDAVGRHQGFTEIEIITSLIATALIVPGIWAVAGILRARTPRLAALGGWLMATGYVFSLVLALETAVVLAVARAGGDPSVFVDAMDNHAPVSLMIVYGVFGLGALLGGLILGIAMVRQRGAVPAWAGWALIASEPVRAVGLLFGLAVGPPLASLLILAAFAGTMLADRSSAVTGLNKKHGPEQEASA